MKNLENAKKWVNIICKIVLTGVTAFLSFAAVLIIGLLTGLSDLNIYILMGTAILFFAFLIWFKNRKKALKIFGILFVPIAIYFIIYFSVEAYDKSITINTTPNINVYNYLPFDENSKIVTLEKEASLKLTEDLPRVDGAAAVFPVYSAFVNAVYPEDTKLYDGNFEHHQAVEYIEGYFNYNNTVKGYEYLGQKKTDIFFGAYPSEGQIEAARLNKTEFVYTPIGYDAFVFFVHKNNPIDNLTTEQVRAIYSGEITNWSEVGGKNEEISAYQRNPGSGSQSMLIRFMDGKEIMEAPSEMVDTMMSGIIEQVSDYRSKPGSIGFSFRYYVEGIIKNPDIKLLSIDGVAPTVENIKNGRYPITASLYAVTYEGNHNKNVEKLIDWILSEEGQEIIEKTGYVGIN